jgi:hypothetical protein
MPAVAAVILGFLGVAAAGGLVRSVPRYSAFATPKSVRAAG